MRKPFIVRPTGLKGNEKLDRMRELMGASQLNEDVKNSVVELTKIGPDGKVYGIVREGHNYFIKVTDKKSNIVTEDFKYIGGLMNKTSEAYPTYAKAIKQLNLKFMSLNEAYGKQGNFNVFEDDNLLTEHHPYKADQALSATKGMGDGAEYIVDKAGVELSYDSKEGKDDSQFGDNLADKDVMDEFEAVRLSENEMAIDEMLVGEDENLNTAQLKNTKEFQDLVNYFKQNPDEAEEVKDELGSTNEAESWGKGTYKNAYYKEDGVYNTYVYHENGKYYKEQDLPQGKSKTVEISKEEFKEVRKQYIKDKLLKVGMSAAGLGFVGALMAGPLATMDIGGTLQAVLIAAGIGAGATAAITEDSLYEAEDVARVVDKVEDKIEDILSPEEIQFLKSQNPETIANVIDDKIDEADDNTGRLKNIIDKIVKNTTIASLIGAPVAMVTQATVAAATGIPGAHGVISGGQTIISPEVIIGLAITGVAGLAIRNSDWWVKRFGKNDTNQKVTEAEKIKKKFEKEYGKEGEGIYYATAKAQGRDPKTFEKLKESRKGFSIQTALEKMDSIIEEVTTDKVTEILNSLTESEKEALLSTLKKKV